MFILNLLYTFKTQTTGSEMAIPLFQYCVPFSVAYGNSDNSKVTFITYNGKKYDFSGYALPALSTLRVMSIEQAKEFKFPPPWDPTETSELPMPSGQGTYEALVGVFNPKDPSWFQREFKPLAKTPIYTSEDGQSLSVVTWLRADPNYVAQSSSFDIWLNSKGKPSIDDRALRNQIPDEAREMISNLDYSDLVGVTKAFAVLAQLNLNEEITHFHPNADSNLTPLLTAKLQGKAGAIRALISSAIGRLGSNKKVPVEAAFDIANSVIEEPVYWSQYLPQTVDYFKTPETYNPSEGRVEYHGFSWYSNVLDLTVKIKVHNMQAQFVGALCDGPSIYNPAAYLSLISSYEEYWSQHPELDGILKVRDAWYLEGLVRLGCPKLASQVTPVSSDILTRPDSGFQDCNNALKHWQAILSQVKPTP